MHRTVLLKEVVDALRVAPGETFLDCTIGSGGHALAVARAAGGPITLVGMDEDEDALARARAAFTRAGFGATLRRENFRNLTGPADAILFDLGVSTEELLASGRGFSFQKDEPLLMTFRKDGERVTAREVVNSWSEENLMLVIKGFGGERRARAIAHAIAAARARRPLETTRELADLIAAAAPRRRKIHPATKTFQAIRMAVNDEVGALREGLEKALAALSPGGRLAIISFHSVEDRIVKEFFKKAEASARGRGSKKPIVPSREERVENPHSRSAKLRIFVKNL